MARYLIVRKDFNGMENNYADAVVTSNVGVAPNEEVAKAFIVKYQKATEPYRYASWSTDWEGKTKFYLLE